jgi:hypothetical protein
MKNIIAIAAFAIFTSTAFSQLGFQKSAEEREKERAQLFREIDIKDSLFMASFEFDLETYKKELFAELNRVRRENRKAPVVLTKDTSRINSVERFVHDSHLVWERDLAHDPSRGISFEVTHWSFICAYDIRKYKEEYYKFLANKVISSLMSSPPHREIILTSTIKEVYIGHASKYVNTAKKSNKVVIRLWK